MCLDTDGYRRRSSSWPSRNSPYAAPRRALAHRLARRERRSIAELAFGIHKIRPDQRAKRLLAGLDDWRRRFASRIFGLTEEAALAYGETMGTASSRGRFRVRCGFPAAALVALTGAPTCREMLVQYTAFSSGILE